MHSTSLTATKDEPIHTLTGSDLGTVTSGRAQTSSVVDSCQIH